VLLSTNKFNWLDGPRTQPVSQNSSMPAPAPK